MNVSGGAGRNFPPSRLVVPLPSVAATVEGMWIFPVLVVVFALPMMSKARGDGAGGDLVEGVGG